MEICCGQVKRSKSRSLLHQKEKAGTEHRLFRNVLNLSSALDDDPRTDIDIVVKVRDVIVGHADAA